MVEDAVQAVYRRLKGEEREGKSKAGWGVRLVGYVWTMLFLAWSSPAWVYPVLRADRGQERDRVLPFSFFGAWRGQV